MVPSKPQIPENTSETTPAGGNSSRVQFARGVSGKQFHLPMIRVGSRGFHELKVEQVKSTSATHYTSHTATAPSYTVTVGTRKGT